MRKVLAKLMIIALAAVVLMTAGASAAPQSTSSGASSGSTSTSHKSTSKKKKSAHRRTARREPFQKAPTADRISEIQTALSRGGYFDGDPNGKWDSNTVAAMQKFQSANGLNSSGKIDATTLQKLGLGSSTAGVDAPKPIKKSDGASGASSASSASVHPVSANANSNSASNVTPAATAPASASTKPQP